MIIETERLFLREMKENDFDALYEVLAVSDITIETVYTLGFIPNGYEMDKFFIGQYMTKMTWKNENGDRLVLSQGILDGSFIIATEEANRFLTSQMHQYYNTLVVLSI